jgi:translocation and assembly module TamB
VKRYTLHIAVGLLLLLTLATLLGGYWLTSTSAGADWLVRGLAGRMPDTLAVASVEGCLADELVLSGIELRWSGGTASVGRLVWRWRDLQWLRRSVRLRGVQLEDVTLVTLAREETSASPPDVTWPRLPGWLRRLRILVDELQVRRLTWRRPRADPFYLEGLATRVRWQRGRLRLPWLTALCDRGALTARLEADGRRPHLRLQAALLLKPGPHGAVPLVVALSAQPADEPRALGGEVRVSGFSKATGGWELASPWLLRATDLSLAAFALQPLYGRGAVRGRARLDWAQSRPRLEFSAELENLNLVALAGEATSLSGNLNLSADAATYAGRLALANQGEGWRNLRAEASFKGDYEAAVLSDVKVLGLGGVIEGDGHVRWAPRMEIRGTFSGRNLNPETAGLVWPGDINLQAEGAWSRSRQGALTAEVKARLLPSTLRGHPLRGRVEARLQNGDTHIDALQLQGRGLNVTAKGRLRQRIDFAAQVDDLGGVVPALGGFLQGRGWLRWRNRQAAGELAGSGRNLRYGDMMTRTMRFSASLAEDRSGALDVRLEGVKSDGLNIPALSLNGQGRLDRHRLTARMTLPGRTRLQLEAAGGQAARAWRGELTKLDMRDSVGALRLAAPAALAVSAKEFRLAPLLLKGAPDEQLSASARLQFAPLVGRAELAWRNLALAHARPWLAGGSLDGSSSGRAAWRRSADGDFEVQAALEGAGRFERDRLRLDLTGATASLAWRPARLQADIRADMGAGGRLEGSVQGGRSRAMALPEQLSWQWVWHDLDLRQLSPWLPTDMALQGLLTGQSRGELLADRQLTAEGTATIRGGQVLSRDAQGRITVPVDQAELSWRWREDRLSGRVDLQLGDYGRFNGSFRLPVAARLPVRLLDEGELDVALDGRGSELGLLTALLPGAVQETRGRLEINLRGTGTWGKPRLAGRVQLREAGAYLPVAGLELQNVQLLARLEQERILLDNLSLRSGEGTLQGRGSLQLHDWRPGNYDVTLTGRQVQLVNLPELQVQADPDLHLTGSPSELRVTGSIRLPEVLIRDDKTPLMVGSSEDVVMVGRPAPEKAAADFLIRTDIRLLLGDHVLVKTSGLDARLSGELHLSAIGAEDLNADGRIAVAEGLYAAYGTRLDITRGNLLFNGPLDRPTLDIVALRTIGKVKAGVQVSGTPQQPVVKLTSEPAMSDSDRLAYIVLGRASARNAGEADLLMAAGGLLLSQGESVVLRDRLKRQLGLDVLGFEAGGGEDDVTGSMLTIGKYLSPSLYVSIGQSLFTNTQEFRLRYSLGKRWELQSTTGEESGVDLFYKIEFQ